MTSEEKERLRPHFQEEDRSFLIRCMTHRNKACNGCRYISLCDEILTPKNEAKNDKCKIAGKCEEYEKLRAKGVSEKEARAILE